MNFHIINGPNLNLLGRREPEIYGSTTFIDYLEELTAQFPDHNIQYFQSNHEGELIDKLHEIGFSSEGIILNAGAYTHTSIALADAIKAIDSAVVEVHISNIYEREAFRHHSYLSPNCIAAVVGHGMAGYADAIEILQNFHKDRRES